ncbi:hypothetical protein [Hyphomonas sp. L-53-1-40]|uniref:hypothetical protein n=1 Tax=Hyphomonas sp. L-53-1-40 TaxID=1207058 RepID=UPI001F31E3A7|nr:hypothetical protein [Hyphomonas sp. L-53-1-40]
MKQLTPMIALSALVLAACGQPETPASETPAPETPPVETASTEASPLDAAIAGEHRTDAEKARDAWRHPKETLEFFGVEADDKVVRRLVHKCHRALSCQWRWHTGRSLFRPEYW